MMKTVKTPAQNEPEWGNSELEEFRTLALRYVEIGAHAGVRIIPYASPDMPLLQKASLEQQKKAISFLRTIVSIHEETLAAGEKTIESKKLVWRALSKLGFVPSPDIFANFTDDDLILIYQEDQLAIFWSLQFFRYSSVTIEQLFFGHWYKFTKRKSEYVEKLQSMVMDILSGKIQGNFHPPVPGHEVEEIDTLECLKTWMEFPFGSVLTKNGKMAGILLVQKMRIID